MLYHPPMQSWVLTVTLSKLKKIKFYTSTNLRDWLPTGEFTLNDSVKAGFLKEGEDSSAEWRSAEMFPLYSVETDQFRWVLVLNLKSSGGY